MKAAELRAVTVRLDMLRYMMIALVVASSRPIEVYQSDEVYSKAAAGNQVDTILKVAFAAHRSYVISAIRSSA
jgi:hypothetical protein